MHGDRTVDAEAFPQRRFAQRSEVIRGDGEGHQARARLFGDATAAIAGEVLRRVELK